MLIVLADDHVMVREGLRPFLERLDEGKVTVLEAGSLPEVMAILGREPKVDLLVLDLRMPGMDGLNGLRRVRADYPGITTVILSSMVDRDQMLETINLGAAGYIPKHLSGAAMISALRLVLSGERFLPSMLLNSEPTDRGANTAAGKLTPREREVLMLLREGLPNKVIANRLQLSEVTVKSHLFSIFRKLGVQNRVQAARRLVELAEI
jgi:two-component system nitrate/nitrite response regulator NarL